MRMLFTDLKLQIQFLQYMSAETTCQAKIAYSDNRVELHSCAYFFAKRALFFSLIASTSTYKPLLQI